MKPLHDFEQCTWESRIFLLRLLYKRNRQLVETMLEDMIGDMIWNEVETPLQDVVEEKLGKKKP